MKLQIKDTFNKELPADKRTSNTRRQVLEACFSYATPRIPTDPKLLHFSDEFATELGLSAEDVRSEEFLHVFSGTKVFENTTPYAMCYGGHQFGNWAGQLGDGRAINLFEIEHNNQRWALQLKGAGETPYSRTADGLAVLRSSIREHLCSEAMHYLGVPTTRSLSLVTTGDYVLRDVLYNGNPAYEKGAIVCRAAPSFIRFGNFQLFAARQDFKTLKLLTDYTIKHFFSEQLKTTEKESYVAFFREVAHRTLQMVLHWQRVGFVHGVMNTDNLSILGLTIDYGPYGWLENYDLDWTPNTTDAQGRRYRFRSQPDIALWNLVQLANALYPLIEEAEPLQEILDDFGTQFSVLHEKMMFDKLGLRHESDKKILTELQKNLRIMETDMTIFFRNLGNIQQKDTNETAFQRIEIAFYEQPIKKENWLNWLEMYLENIRLQAENDNERKAKMNVVNPKYVLRNYMAQLAIDAAETGDNSVINELYELLKKPYSEQPENEKWFAKRPEWARNKVGCSMLSCSS
jgi:serine/tyrosine/threonine adenylyltransferase